MSYSVIENGRTLFQMKEARASSPGGLGKQQLLDVQMLHEQGMLVPPRALEHSIKACSTPGSASSSLASLSSNNKVSLSLLCLSLWAEVLCWWLLRLMLGCLCLALQWK